MLQAIINILYRYPRSYLKMINSMGGFRSYQCMKQGQKQMRNAALSLPPVHSFANGLPVYFLTGKNYLYQTLFCITSLAKVSKERFKFILVDDGSFTEQHINQIAKQLPGSKIILKKEIDGILSNKLPRDKFPAIYKKREIYPHLKKLTDVHFIPGNNWKLVLDSDMLFWQEPLAIINWLKEAGHPIHMLDCVESYGYPTELMQQLCGHVIPELLNVGAIGLKSESIKWNELESWIIALEEKCGASYYLEQTLTAMLVAGYPTTVLAADKYKVNPALLADGAVLHHYVDLSKKLYFTEAWKKMVLN